MPGPSEASRPVRRCDVLADCLPHGADEWAELDLSAMRAGEPFAPLREVLVGDDGASFERTLGVALPSLERVAIARYPRGLIALLRGRFAAADAVRHVGARMNTVEIERDAPARRIGYLGSRRVDVFAIGPDTLAIAAEHAAPAERALARAAGAPIDSLYARLEPSEREAIADAPVVVHGRRVEFEGDTAPADAVISHVERLTLTLRASGDRLDLSLLMLGDLPESAASDVTRWVRGLAITEFGSLAGISAALPTLTLVPTHGSSSRSGFRLALALPPDPVCEVLRVWRIRAVADVPTADR